jgi:hypothetical protein
VRAGTGLRDAVLAEPDARVAPSQWGRLVLNAIAIGGDPGIGLAFGLLLKPTVHGFLGYATLTARDIRDALRVTQRYFRMRNRQYRLTYWRTRSARRWNCTACRPARCCSIT